MVLKKKNNVSYIYNSSSIRKIINNLSRDGKVQKVERVLFDSLTRIKFRIFLNPLVFLLFILNEIKPCIVLKSLRLGSMVYRIPVPLENRKQIGIGIKLLLNSIKENRTGSFVKDLEVQLSLVLENKSSLLKKNSMLYKISSNARAFAHYRWS